MEKAITLRMMAIVVLMLLMASKTPDSRYRIKKIERINSWYVIYAKKDQALYKIVSKIAIDAASNCKKIVTSYELKLVPRRNTAPTINGVKLDPTGYTGCFQFDQETNICLEPDRNIYELYFSKDLKGICYLP